MSFEIKPNKIDSQNEVVALIQANGPSSATPQELGLVYGKVDSITYNFSIGHSSLFSNTTGTTNSAFGYQSLRSNTEGGSNEAFGYQSLLSNTTGNGNIAIGFQSLLYNSTASNNIGIGGGTLQENITGNFNLAVGNVALLNNTTGAKNSAFGAYALRSNTTGSDNTAIGYQAGNSGVNNITTGSNNIIIGHNAAASSSTVSNVITLGNSSITTIRAQVTSITSLSDARDKKNIESLPTGLEFVNSLNPVKFDWNMRDGGKIDVPDTGFIAQDLVQLEDETGIADYLKLTFRDNPDKLEASYGRLVPVLVKAIQDLSAKVNEIEEKLNG